MRSHPPSRRALLLLIAAAATFPTSAIAEPLPLVRGSDAHVPALRVQAALLHVTVTLGVGRDLAALLLDSGLDEGEAAAAAAAADGHFNGQAPCRVKLALGRDRDSGVLQVHRLTLASASAQTVIERRGESLKVVSTSSARLRIG